MSEHFAEQLSRFTPDGGELDRDAVLFRAGRASARPNRPWLALAASLAVCQLVTLTLLWPRSGATPEPIVSPKPAAVPERSPESPPAGASFYVLRDQALATEGNLPPPAPVENLMPPASPLRAFAVSLTSPSD